MEPSVSTTVIKCLLVKAISILPELQEIIKSYAFHDTTTDKFQHRQKYRTIMQIIDHAYSRKNDCIMSERWNFTPTHPHEYTTIGAISCNKCGNYKMSSNLFGLSENTRMFCFCSYQSGEYVHTYDDDYYLEELEEHDFDY